MNKDEVKGKAKDTLGRIERQAGEWTGDSEKEAHGTAKQVEGKIQNAWGNAKDALKNPTDEQKKNRAANDEEGPKDEADSEEDFRSARKAS